jgi:hypothetical protein
MNTQLARCKLEMYFPDRGSMTLSACLPLDRLGVGDLDMDELARHCMDSLLEGLGKIGLGRDSVVRTRVRASELVPLTALIAARDAALQSSSATHMIVLDSGLRHHALRAEFDVCTDLPAGRDRIERDASGYRVLPC